MNESATSFLFGIRIDEPVITFTDLLVSAICFLFAFRIRKTQESNRTIFFFKLYFLFLGIASLLGGIIGHAFLYKLNIYWKLAGWVPCMLAIASIGFAVIEHSRIILNDSFVKLLKGINILVFIYFLFLVIQSIDFVHVVIHSFFGLVFLVFCLEGYLYLKIKNQASGYFMGGVVVAAIAAILFSNKISFGYWLDYQGVSHLLIVFTVIFFNEGTKRIEVSVVKANAL